MASRLRDDGSDRFALRPLVIGGADSSSKKNVTPLDKKVALSLAGMDSSCSGSGKRDARTSVTLVGAVRRPLGLRMMALTGARKVSVPRPAKANSDVKKSVSIPPPKMLEEVAAINKVVITILADLQSGISKEKPYLKFNAEGVTDLSKILRGLDAKVKGLSDVLILVENSYEESFVASFKALKKVVSVMADHFGVLQEISKLGVTASESDEEVAGGTGSSKTPLYVSSDTLELFQEVLKGKSELSTYAKFRVDHREAFAAARATGTSFKPPANVAKDFGVLGRGSYGTVRYVPKIGAKELVEKTFIPTGSDPISDMKVFIKEAKWMVSAPPVGTSPLVHAVLLQTTHKMLRIVMQRAKHDLFAESMAFGLDNPIQTFVEVAKAGLGSIVTLGSNGYSHNDLKPDNFLRFSTGDVKVTDFGITDKENTTRAGTGSYLAPEITSATVKGKNNSKSDLWALGVTLYSILGSNKNGESQLANFNSAVIKSVGLPHKSSYLYALPEEVEGVVIDDEVIANYIDSLPKELGFTNSVKNFLKGILKRNPDDRFSIENAAEALARIEVELSATMATTEEESLVTAGGGGNGNGSGSGSGGASGATDVAV